MAAKLRWAFCPPGGIAEGMVALLLSMTGFGEARQQSDTAAVSVEIRTINNRYFKLSLRSTEAYAALESQVEATIRKFIKRGSVQVQIRVERERSADDYRINRSVVESYLRQLRSMADEWHLPESFPVEPLLGLPGVIEENLLGSGDVAEDWPLVERTLEAALANLTKMRSEEGQALATDLRANCRTILTQLDKIEGRMPRVAEEYRDRLADRIGKALEKYSVKLEPGDLVREISLFMERSDISEEIVRLRSHIEQFEATLGLAESSGRKLDFLSQEMGREANTIGSKSSDVEIPHYVIEIKTAVERIREQVQNVE